MPFPLLHLAALIRHSPSSLIPTRNAVSAPICCDCGQPFSAPSAFGGDGLAQHLPAFGLSRGEGLFGGGPVEFRRCLSALAVAVGLVCVHFFGRFFCIRWRECDQTEVI